MKYKLGSLGFKLASVVGLSVAVGGVTAQSVTGVDAQGQYVKGRVVVQARAGVGLADVERAAMSHGARARAIGATGLYVFELPPQASETAVAQRLARSPQFKFAELDRRFKSAFTPNDTYYASQWHSAKINAPAAWDYTGGDTVTIAILDAGVDGTHPDLVAQMVAGWNVQQNNSDTRDVLGHGTAVAGVAAATMNNAAGYAGLAGRAKIMPVRIAGADGWADASVTATGITWAADHGARVVNISYSGMAGNSTVLAAADYMRSKGGLVIVSAGNAGVDEGFAATTKVISVSATDSNDLLTSWSSWGNYVAVAAPGLNIACTMSGGAYGTCWGTSMSAPLVSATVALMMAAKPSLSNAQIESLLYSTAVDLGSPGRDKQYGYGRIDAGAAVRAAAGTAQTVDTTAPSVAIQSPVAGATVSGTVVVDVGASDNVGVSKVELRVNGNVVATDTSSPHSFSWDTARLANGMASLVAVAFDAAGNAASSSTVSVNVANNATVMADTTPPVVTILNPLGGSISGNALTLSTSASDNAGAAGITQSLYIDGALKATVSGGSLTYKWNIRRIAAGVHTLQVVARDTAGNSSSASVLVTR